jgi:hypothetical protein
MNPIPGDNPFFWDTALVENKFTGGRGPDAHFAFLFSETEPRIPLFNDEGTGPARAFTAIGDGDHRINVRLTGIGDPLLGPIQEILVAFEFGGGHDPPGIAAGRGFGEGKSSQLPPAGDLRKIFFLLLFASIKKDRIGTQTAGRKTGRNPQTPPAQFLHSQTVFKRTAPEPSVLLGDTDPEEIRLGDGLQQVSGKFFFFIQFGPYRFDLFLSNFSGDFFDHLLFFG